MKTFKKRSVKESTYDRLITSYDALKKYDISKKNIEDITAIDIQEYVNQLADQYAYTGILKMMRIVTAPLSKAAALHQIPSNPSIGIELPNKNTISKVPRNNEAYTIEEQERLLRVLASRSHPAHDLIVFMLQTGLRIGECLALEWDDIDMHKRSIRINKTVAYLANQKISKVMNSAKTFKSNRVIPFNKTTFDLLTLIKKKSKGSFVFSDKDGHRLSYEAVRYQTQKACNKANIPYKGEHVFRHTFATNSYHKNVDIKILSKLLGHASTSITYDTYVNLYGDGFEDMKNAIS